MRAFVQESGTAFFPLLQSEEISKKKMLAHTECYKVPLLSGA
jgi:hypothetical protein